MLKIILLKGGEKGMGVTLTVTPTSQERHVEVHFFKKARNLDMALIFKNNDYERPKRKGKKPKMSKAVSPVELILRS